MKYLFFIILLTVNQVFAQKTTLSLLPRLGHDFIVGTGNVDFLKGGRYVFEKTGQANLSTPSNWYAGLGVETYNASSPIRLNFDALFIDRSIDQKLPTATNTYTARALKGKASIKYVFGDFETQNHFYVAVGGAYTANLSEKLYENGIAKQSVITNTSGGASLITGIGYEWEPSSSSVSTSDAVVGIGIYYNRDLFSFINSSPDIKLSYINVSLNLKGVLSLFAENPNN